MYVLFRLHSRWESSPLPPDQLLGQNITCAISSAVTDVGSFLLFRLIHRLVQPDPPFTAVGSILLFRLIHRWVVQKSPSQIQCVGASRHPVTPATTRRHCIGLAVERLFTGRERLTLCSPFHGAACSLLASGEGRKRKVTSNQTPTNTPCASTAIGQAKLHLFVLYFIG